MIIFLPFITFPIWSHAVFRVVTLFCKVFLIFIPFHQQLHCITEWKRKEEIMIIILVIIVILGMDSMWKSFVLLFFLRNQNRKLRPLMFTISLYNHISCITCCHVWNWCGMMRLKWVENQLFGFHLVHNFCFCPVGLTSQRRKFTFSNGREWWWCEDVFCCCLCHLVDTNDYEPDYVSLSVSVLSIPHKVESTIINNFSQLEEEKVAEDVQLLSVFSMSSWHDSLSLFCPLLMTEMVMSFEPLIHYSSPTPLSFAFCLFPSSWIF